MTLRLLVAHTPAERDAARRVEERVFLRAFGNTPEVMEREYGPYDSRSRFIAVIDDADGSALGAARFVLPDDAGEVKTLTDVAGPPWHLSADDVLGAAGLSGRPVWDVATLAVDPRFRTGRAGAELNLALCYAIGRYALDCHVPGLVAILDDRVLRLLQFMGLPWEPMAGASSREYLGSPASTPCLFLVDDGTPSVRARRPDLVPGLVDGVFASITVDPADLAPERGAPLPEPDPLPVSPLPPRRDTTGWRPPTSRGAELRAGAPGV
ncbi:hypothetical protein [Trujillonella endophytica]|uniref:Uncharacterized protein n=1 Tax=Trujillonella endophytica TaxID=673521 RepID=A0A1H8V460_9ACTN|nr:hypothetical protein [Trujillella endophytica]SEP10280.1 hypothetical protein SAMN05660991_03284 [Trujillella endophytica]